jgi:WD40 repeat protein
MKVEMRDKRQNSNKSLLKIVVGAFLFICVFIVLTITGIVEFPNSPKEAIAPTVDWSKGARKVASLRGIGEYSDEVIFSPNGRFVFAGGKDKTLKIWNSPEGALIKTINVFGDRMASLAISPDGQYVITGSYNWTKNLESEDAIELWNASTGALIKTLDTENYAGAVFFPNGMFAITGGEKIWSIPDGNCVKILKEYVGNALSPDGRLSICDNNMVDAELWSIPEGTCVRTLKGHSDIINSFAFSPNGRYALTGGYDNTAKLWNVHRGNCVRTLEGHGADINKVIFSPDGRFALTGSLDSTAKLWSVPKGKCVSTFTGHTDQVVSIAFSPDNCFALTGSLDDTAKLWSVPDGREIATLKEQRGFVTFSPDGRYLLTRGIDDTATIWEPEA